jgi:hypothetical protein
MFMRRRPLLRTAVIGGGAYVAGKKSAQRSAEQAQQQDQAQQSNADEPDNKDEQNKDEQNERIVSPQQQKGPGSAVPKPTMLDELHQLNILHQQGALTDTEFTAAKSKLLGSG